jgi:glycosyltransferase involved in cell wall biosynthesis
MAAAAATPPTVSVVVTTNRLDLFFRRAIHSIKHQKTPPDEVVVVIDGLSWKLKDEKVLKDFPIDWKLVWTEGENSGPAMPRNMGMYHATGDWILILDGDDIIVPSCVDSYLKILPHIKADMVAEFQVHSLVHQGIFVTKKMPPDRTAWNDVVRAGTKTLISAGWKRGEMPIRPILIKNDGKKYYPIDFAYQEDKVLIFHYMIEERRIILSDYCGYVRNVHAKSLTNSLSGWGMLQRDDTRFKKIAGNINLNNWTLRDRVFESWKSHLYLTDEDRDYINDTIKYFSTL